MGILVAMLLAFQAPSSPPAVAPRPILPFGNGQLSIIMRSWSDAAISCEATGSDPQFAAFATRQCENIASDRPHAADAVMIGEVTTIIVTTRAGEDAPSVPAPRGRRMIDIETEVELAQDGRVTACRIVRETIDPQASAGPRPGTFCDEMLSSPSVFGPVGQAPPRRGRVRLITDSAQPPRN